MSAEVCMQRSNFQSDSLSTLQIVGAKLRLNYIVRKYKIKTIQIDKMERNDKLPNIER